MREKWSQMMSKLPYVSLTPSRKTTVPRIGSASTVWCGFLAIQSWSDRGSKGAGRHEGAVAGEGEGLLLSLLR